ncbi:MULTISPECIES: hypothetical protein [Microbacterium]|uniref:hypothetical protein n=1 Tax=Microbacterium TaxID=33882 RepID=UPI000D6505AF|nr:MULTISPECIES: hypothetical protein [Microbacterium]
MFRRSAIAAAAIAALTLAGAAAPAAAGGPPYVENWVDEGGGIAQEAYAPLCEGTVDFEVHFSYRDEGRFQLMERRGELYGQSTHHGEWTWWNPANGESLVVQVNGLDRDQAVATNEDGTVSLIAKSTSSFVAHTAHGARLIGSGAIWVELHIDLGPTESPDDDVVTVVDVPKGVGPEGQSFCELVADELG